MNGEQLGITVDAVSRTHPMSIVINLLFIDVLLFGLYGLFFDKKALYGVLIYIFVGFVVRLVFFGIFKAYLRSNYKQEAATD